MFITCIVEISKNITYIPTSAWYEKKYLKKEFLEKLAVSEMS